jgi:hypothetical protein
VKSAHETLSWSRVDSHDTLVTSTVVLQVTVVQTLSDIGRLLLDGNQDVAGLVVETMTSNQKVPSSIPCAVTFLLEQKSRDLPLLGRGVSDLLDGVTNDLLVVDSSGGGDLTEDYTQGNPRKAEQEKARSAARGHIEYVQWIAGETARLTHDHTGLGSGLTGDLGVGVLSQTSIENGVRDLVTDLVGVTLTATNSN